jgi:hypothetical protein
LPLDFAPRIFVVAGRIDTGDFGTDEEVVKAVSKTGNANRWKNFDGVDGHVTSSGRVLCDGE